MDTSIMLKKGLEREEQVVLFGITYIYKRTPKITKYQLIIRIVFYFIL